MDISVSGLNGRLASKLPLELPLGLVFVVGKVEQPQANGFVLVEGTHRLQCRTEELGQIATGDEVRASGHLMFDSERLQYFLLARDLEVITPEPLGNSGSSRELLAESEGLLTALASVKARAAVAPSHSGEALPVWVRKLAPPEVQDGEGDDEAVEKDRLEVPKGELDDNLVSLLSEAMDSEEEMELTPELLAKYAPEMVETEVETAVPAPKFESQQQMEEPLANLTTSYHPANRQDTDWLVILLIISFFVLTIAAIVTIVLLLV